MSILLIVSFCFILLNEWTKDVFNAKIPYYNQYFHFPHLSDESDVTSLTIGASAFGASMIFAIIFFTTCYYYRKCRTLRSPTSAVIACEITESNHNLPIAEIYCPSSELPITTVTAQAHYTYQM